MSKKLLVAPCSYEAAKFACENYHYAKSMIGGKSIKHGVWENDEFIGVILYGDTTNRNIGVPYNLDYTQICELSRVALREHTNQVTKIISKSLKLLHYQNPKLLLVVSYADMNYNHIGIIYQAGNWIYDGKTKKRYNYLINGKLYHGKTVYDTYGTSKLDFLRKNVDPNSRLIRMKDKFRYLYPLTKSCRKKLEKRKQPYPKMIE